MTRTSILFTVGLVACTESGNLLDIEFDRLDVASIDWERIDSEFVFRIDNPNPIQIELARFEYTLAFADIEWLSGSDPDGLQVAAEDSSEVALPVAIGFASLYEMVQATRGLDDIPFTLEGSFGFDTPWGPLDVPYDTGGDFPALRTPGVELDRVRLAELGLSSATIDVDLAVDNDHESNLWFSDFDYTLVLEGSEVASGLISDLGEATGAGTSTLSIPVEISYLDAGTGIYDALSSSSIDVGIEAVTDVETPFGTVPLDIDETASVRIERARSSRRRESADLGWRNSLRAR